MAYEQLTLSGKNIFPRVPKDALRLGAVCDTPAAALHAGRPMKWTGSRACDVVAAATDVSFGVVLHKGDTANNDGNCTLIPYAATLEMWAEADGAVDAGQFLAATGYNSTTKLGTYRPAQNGDIVCAVALADAADNAEVKILTQAPFTYYID